MQWTYDYARRRDKLRRRLASSGADALLITHRPNIRYLTGFRGDDSVLVVTRDDAVLISDERFRQEIEETCPDVSAEIRGSNITGSQWVARVLTSMRLSRIAIEGDHVPVSVFAQWQASVERTQWRVVSGWVEALREIKDRTEIAAIRRSIAIAEKAYQAVATAMTPEDTEQQVAWELERQIRHFGGEGCSFPPIVAVGARAALPHAVPGPRTIGEKPFLLIDWGATFDEYCSDLTRMMVAGRIPPKLARIYEVVLQAQLAAIDRIKPGVMLEDVDQAARRVIEDAGQAKHFTHALGHGIGLEIHEAPRVAAGQSRPLRPGMVITVEPGIYLRGWGGVRIEDDVLVTRTGHEVLTSLPKSLEASRRIDIPHR